MGGDYDSIFVQLVIATEIIHCNIFEALYYKPRKSRVRFPMVTLEFFIEVILALGLTQPVTEMSTRNISLGVKGAGA